MLIKYNRRLKNLTEIENSETRIVQLIDRNQLVFCQNEIGIVLKDTENYCYNSKLHILDNVCHLTTESSGYFQLYYHNTLNEIYISDSIFKIVPLVNELTLNKQNCLEYINMSTVLGNETIFNEIKKFKPHSVYDLDKMSDKKLAILSYDTTANIASLEHAIETYFQALKKLNQTIYVDLSGGYDTRTALSALIYHQVPFELVTNNRLESVSPDIKIAEKIAKKLNKELNIINIEPSTIDPNDFSAIDFSEMVRGLDVCFRLKEEISNKTNLNGIKLGGWGAEMIRNQYGSDKTFDQIINGFAYNKLKLSNKTEEKDYLTNIKNKLENELDFWEINQNHPKFSQLLHYRIKARHWAGSMLTMRNNHTSTLFPFYHPEIALISNLLPENNTYQNQLIKKYAPMLVDIPFSSGDKPLSKVEQIKFESEKFLRKLLRKLGIKNTLKTTTDYPFPIYEIKDNPIFAEFLNISKDHLIKTNQNHLITKYFVILSIVNRFIKKYD